MVTQLQLAREQVWVNRLATIVFTFVGTLVAGMVIVGVFAAVNCKSNDHPVAAVALPPNVLCHKSGGPKSIAAYNSRMYALCSDGSIEVVR